MGGGRNAWIADGWLGENWDLGPRKMVESNLNMLGSESNFGWLLNLNLRQPEKVRGKHRWERLNSLQLTAYSVHNRRSDVVVLPL